MFKRIFVTLIIVMLLAIALTACGANSAPAPASTAVPEPELTPLTVGLVTAIGGIDEKFFSAQAWKGIQKAENLFNIESSYKESATEDDYTALLEEFVSQKTDLTIAVGAEMAQSVQNVAKAHPDNDFVIIDSESSAPNVRGVTFDVISPSYMAGYLAGGMSQTGTVCTYGASNDKAITDYMLGFVNGADYYRRQNGSNLDILGWDVYTKEGVFLKDATSEEEAYQIATDFFNQGCDVIFAVAKDAAKGSARAAQEKNKMFIGTTVDWYETFPEYGNVVLTSVMKNTDKAVFDNVVNYAAGSFKGGEDYVGALDNDGVQLAPYHLFEEQVTQNMREQLKQVKLNIFTGHLDPTSPWIFGENNQPAPEEDK